MESASSDQECLLIAEQTKGFLSFIAEMFNSNESLNSELQTRFGWIDMVVVLRSADGAVNQAICFRDGKAWVPDEVPEKIDCTLVFRKAQDIMDQINASPDEAFKMILRGQVIMEGNIMSMGLWNYLINLILGVEQQKAVDEQIAQHQVEKKEFGKEATSAGRNERIKRRSLRLVGKREDPGVVFLNDPYLPQYSLDHFPRLQQMKEERLNARCEFTSEYSRMLTDFHIEQGYEIKAGGEPWEPNLRKAESLKYCLERKLPLNRPRDLLAGTWTTNPILGAVAHPFAEAPYMWGELRSCSQREYEPYDITEESIEIFHKYVFPYWTERNIHELWKQEYGYPLGARIQEQFFSVFYWATASQSENNAGFERVLKLGTSGIMKMIDEELASDLTADQEKINTLQAMKICLEGVNAYAYNLAEHTRRELAQTTDEQRRQELSAMLASLERVPRYPATTLHEAVQSMMITQISLGWESMDASISLGRLDQVLQPFFVSDMQKLSSAEARESYTRYVIELVGCLFFKIASRIIVAMDLAQWQNSGAPTDTCITVGGVKADGSDGVNDMTYIILKVIEMLAPNDPNTHARYMPGINTMTYLQRAAEVNYITGATPALHNDLAIIDALHQKHGWPLEDVRDYASTGCVEPSIPGRHAATSSALEINLVAPLEMALNNGLHPVSQWDFGPKTGAVQDFKDFESFYDAFARQCYYLFEQAVVGNNQIGEVYQRHQPHPLISSLTEGCIESGRGFMRGGARLNSSGATLIGLSDVVDSLMVLKKLVFTDNTISFADLKKALDSNFVNDAKLLNVIKTKVPRFGSGNQEALEMAKRVMKTVSDYFSSCLDFKGGRYMSGWWSMAHHTSYGRVTGALPCGRLAGEPFTPGLTPNPLASKNLLDNLLDVAQLDHTSMDNNIAFNVKVVPAPHDTREKIVSTMASYVKTYCEQGGMQLQFNVIDSETLKDAMANPEHYRDLIVRISGYLAYFTEIHHELQVELVRRAEYRL